jgi:tetratricopeptide (TPR) repeat protein
MQEPLTVSTPASKPHWLDITEMLVAAGSIGGSIAAVATQQMALAVLPLSLSMSLNLANRQRQMNALAQQLQINFAQLTQHLQTRHQSVLSTLAQQDRTLQTQAELLTQHILDTQATTTEVVQTVRTLKQELQTKFQEQQQELSTAIERLGATEQQVHGIQVQPGSARFYFEQGLTHQRAGSPMLAIESYDAALRQDTRYAEAYYNRGIVRSQMADRQGAILDFREAANLYFEQGDLKSYDKAKEMCNQVHSVPTKVAEPDPELQADTEESIEVLSIESLFA